MPTSKDFIYFCDSCYTEKSGVSKDLDPESVKTNFYRKPFSCVKKEHWLKHIKTDKHIKNIAFHNNLRDDIINECIYCDVRLDDRSYAIHKKRNELMWIGKNAGMDWAKDCSCNNFIYNGKRFNNVKMLREYYDIKHKYSYGKDNNINYKKLHYDKANEILNNKAEHIKRLEESRKKIEERERKKYEKKVEQREKREKERKQKKEENKLMIEKDIKSNRQCIMNEIPLYNNGELTELEKLKEDRLDLNIKPIFEDYCNECGKPDNFIANYPIEKLDRWEVDVCNCGDSDVSDIE